VILLRAANGVGLDTPASTIGILRALKESGHAVGEIPASGDELMRRLLQGPSNAEPRRPETESLSLADYQSFLSRLAPAFRQATEARWGEAESDPFFRPGAEAPKWSRPSW